MDKARILVTGATGFVGRHLVSHLLSSAARPITIVVRHSAACPAEWYDNEQVRIVETGPIETSANLDTALDGATAVIHLAGLAHVTSAHAEAPFVAANTVATQRLSEAAARQGVKSFIHLSSLAAITRNASSLPITDATSEPPSTPYGRSKRDAERHVLSLADQGIFAVSLRPPLVVGFDAKGNWAALQRLASSGLPLPFASTSNRRSLIGIDFLVEAMESLALAAWSPDKSGNYCIADDAPMALRGIVAALRAGMGLPPSMFAFPPWVLNASARIVNREQMAAGLLGNLVVDASRFCRVFDIAPSQQLTDAITESGRLYRQNGRSQ